MTLTPEQKRLVYAVIARAEQACRTVNGHDQAATKACESAIRPHVIAHIEADLDILITEFERDEA